MLDSTHSIPSVLKHYFLLFDDADARSHEDHRRPGEVLASELGRANNMITTPKSPSLSSDPNGSEKKRIQKRRDFRGNKQKCGGENFIGQ